MQTQNQQQQKQKQNQQQKQQHKQKQKRRVKSKCRSNGDCESQSKSRIKSIQPVAKQPTNRTNTKQTLSHAITKQSETINNGRKQKKNQDTVLRITDNVFDFRWRPDPSLRHCDRSLTVTCLTCQPRTDDSSEMRRRVASACAQVTFVLTSRKFNSNKTLCFSFK